MLRVFSSLIICASISGFAQAKPVEVNAIAAKVNGRVITKNEVSFLLAPIFAQLSTQFPRRGAEFNRQFEEARKEVLNELIDREIILDEFKQLGATMNDKAVDGEIDRQIANLYNGDESKFRQELKRSRLTMEGYRDLTREKMVVQAMRSQQFSDTPPPLPSEVRAEYAKIKTTLRDISSDTVTFRKIFIPATEPEKPLATPEDQLALTEALVKKLKSGSDFDAIAKEHSRDAYAAEGGFQEDVPRIDLSPEFASIIFKADEGELVGPLLDPRGFTIVKVIKKNLGASPPLSEVKEMVEQRVGRNKTSKQYDRWIESKRKRAMIDIQS